MSDFEIRDGVLVKYTGAGGKVVIPEEVTRIGPHAFDSCLSLTQITIPDSVTSIGSKAFHDCERLSSITVPGSAEIIEESAFFNCKSLKSATFSSGICSIEGYAFYGCTSLKHIALPDSVIRLGRLAFSHCVKLESIVLSSRLLSIEPGTFEHCIKLSSIVIPDNITYIGDYAFRECRRLCSVSIGSGVRKIGLSAFSWCLSLRSVQLPDGIERIPPSAFDCCPDLNNFIFSRDLYTKMSPAFRTRLVSDEAVLAYFSGSNKRSDDFRYCIIQELRLKKRRVPILEKMTADDSAEGLACVLSLLETKLSIDEIDSYLEHSQGKPAAAAVWIDYKRKNYSDAAVDAHECDKFDAAFGLRELTPAEWRKFFKYVYSNRSVHITGYRGDEKDVIIPKQIGALPVTGIHSFAFSYRNDLLSITIPDGVTSIGKYAFRQCRNLTNITIPDSVTQIAGDAFLFCNETLTIHAPAGSYAARYAAEHKIKFAETGN